MTAVPKHRLTVPEFLDWAARQERGRYELVDGEIVAMAPERARHNLTKASVYRALDDAIRRNGLGCTAYTDGMPVVIDANSRSREPDALVQCGKPIDPDSMIADAPIIVVEVVSPSSGTVDSVDKLADYFSLPSVLHYLIVNPDQSLVIHHQRQGDGPLLTRIVRDGEISMNPPGMVVTVDEILGAG